MTANDGVFEDRRVYWVWISMVLGAGNAAVWELCRGFKHINEFAEALKNGEFDDRLTDRQKKQLSMPFEAAVELIGKCAENGVGVLCYRNKKYPERLRRIPNPPPVLFLRGDTGVLSEERKTVAVIGTRTPTAYSVRTAERLAGELAERGVTVITGIENGIDAISAEAACVSGSAAAVCGRGIFGSDYTPEQTAKIAENGIVLAEYTSHNEFGRVPFDKRNRILCGLADAVLFIECRADSAGLNNVNHAVQLGKPIFALPPSDIYDPRFFGQRDLLRAGAGIVFSADDILAGIGSAGTAADQGDKLAEIGERKQRKKTAVKLLDTSEAGDEESGNVKNEQKNPDEGLHKSEMSATIDISGFSEEQKRVYEAVKENSPVHINQLAELTGMEMNELITELAMLRLEEAVEELSGKRYSAK